MAIHYVDFNKKNENEKQKVKYTEFLTIQKSVADFVDTLSFGGFIIKEEVSDRMLDVLTVAKNVVNCLELISEMTFTDASEIMINPKEFNEEVSSLNISPIFFVMLCKRLEFISLILVSADQPLEQFKNTELTNEEVCINFLFDVIEK